MTSGAFTRVALALARNSSRIGIGGQVQIRWLGAFKPSDFAVDIGLHKSQSLVWKSSYSRRGHGKGQKESSSADVEPEEYDEFSDDDERSHAIVSPGAQRSRGEKLKVKLSGAKSPNNADTTDMLGTLYKDYPELKQYGERELITYFQTMSRYSIDVVRAVEVLLIYPPVISTPDAKLRAVMQALVDIGFNEKQRKYAFRRTPQLLEVPPKKITKQYSFLKTYLTGAETLEAIGKSLEILLESEATLKNKLEYLIKEMSHETKDIVPCKALAYPLKYIKTRHEFLIRAGVFKPIPYRKLIKVLEKDYKDKSRPRDKYFRPLQIVCYNDLDFLKVCTKGLLTLNEYAAFEELYEAELAAQDDQEEEELESGGYGYDNDDLEDFEDDGSNDAVSLVKSTNSVGFMSDAEAKACYF